uniref:M56 family metallopeptidase n=1 Tax=Microbulbifer agarilyticus TaxID=260552 RepID=UPI000255AA64|nr:M56 family metallopeptidase [Microbulbifer agarilyticus]
MINWVLAQQEVLTFVLLVIWLSDLALAKRMGSRFTYRLYALVPVALLAANLPSISLDSWRPALEATPVIHAPVVSTLEAVSGLQNQQVITATNRNFVGYVWLAGASLLIAALIVGLAKLFTLPKKPILDTQFYERLPDGVFYISQKVRGPILKGIFSPEIILPKDFKKSYTANQLDYVFAHELVHAKRYDNLWNLCALILVITFWFNPVVWFAYLRFRLTQECACDEEVLLGANKDKKIQYSKAMVQSYEHWNGFWAIQSHYGDKVTMIKRINRLKNAFKPSKAARILAGGAGAFMLSLALLWGQVSANSPITLNLKDAELVYSQYPRAAFYEGVQGEVHLQFDVVDGEVSSINVLQTVTSGGHEQAFIESATQYLKRLPFVNENTNLNRAERVFRFHLAGVGASDIALQQARERMPHRIIHLLPHSIPTSASEIALSGKPQLSTTKNHFPSYPQGLEELGITATAVVEMDVRESGIGVNARVIRVDAPDEYKEAFRTIAQSEADDLIVFRNNTGRQVDNVRVTLFWEPANYDKGIDRTKLKKSNANPGT